MTLSQQPDQPDLNPPPNEPDAVVRRCRTAALAGLIGLIALGLAWELWLAPTGSGTLAVKVLPLMLCLVGLWRHRMVTFRWLSLLLCCMCWKAWCAAPLSAGCRRRWR